MTFTKSETLTEADQAEQRRLVPFGFAPGNYMNRCHICDDEFVGDKRSVTCKPCAEKMAAACPQGKAVNKLGPSCEIHARYSRGCSECHSAEMIAFRATVASALAELQIEMASMVVSLPAEFWLKRLSATITKLGLDDAK